MVGQIDLFVLLLCSYLKMLFYFCCCGLFGCLFFYSHLTFIVNFLHFYVLRKAYSSSSSVMHLQSPGTSPIFVCPDIAILIDLIETREAYCFLKFFAKLVESLMSACYTVFVAGVGAAAVYRVRRNEFTGETETAEQLSQHRAQGFPQTQAQ